MSDELLPEKAPVVFVRDGAIYANSRDVAAFFGKANADVNKAVRAIIDGMQAIDKQRRFFTPNEIKDLTGASVADYDMTRDGFALLAMGFTGAKALAFKLRYIEQFNAMEATLRASAPLPPRDPMDILRDPAAMRGLLPCSGREA